MKRFLVFAVLAVLPSCSSNVYSYSKHRELLKPGTPRAKIIEVSGKPDSTAMVKEPHSSAPGKVRQDIWLTREVLPDMSAMGAGMLAVMTLGISEIATAPYSWVDHFLIRPRRRLQVWYKLGDKLDTYSVLPAGKDEKAVIPSDKVAKR